MEVPLSRALSRAAARATEEGDPVAADVARWLATVSAQPTPTPTPTSQQQQQQPIVRTVGEALAGGEEAVLDALLPPTSDLHDANALLLALARQVCPRGRTALAALTTETVATGVAGLDEALRGGFARGHVSELVGPAGMGKTQFCLTIAAREAAAGRGVVYVETEGKFPAARLGEMLAARGASPAAAANVSVVLAGSLNSAQLHATMSSLETRILETNASVVVLDSVATICRGEFKREELVERQRVLSKLASTLKLMAETLHVAVVVTNHVVGGPSSSSSSSSAAAAAIERGTAILSDTKNLTAALGNTWSHAINVRVVLERGDDGVSRARVAKSPLSMEAACAYDVSQAGGRGLPLPPDPVEER